MSDSTSPGSIDVPLSSLLHLAVEWWRISASLASAGGGPPAARHGLRRIEDFLKELELEVLTMDGRAFDPGLPLRVIEAVEDRAIPPGEAIISETLSPLILYKGNVVRQADVVTRRGPG